jgi:hypothetical protein
MFVEKWMLIFSQQLRTNLEPHNGYTERRIGINKVPSRRGGGIL